LVLIWLLCVKDTRKFPEKIKEEVNEEEEEIKMREKAGLMRTGRIFGGLINDIKRKKPWSVPRINNKYNGQWI